MPQTSQLQPAVIQITDRSDEEGFELGCCSHVVAELGKARDPHTHNLIANCIGQLEAGAQVSEDRLGGRHDYAGNFTSTEPLKAISEYESANGNEKGNE